MSTRHFAKWILSHRAVVICVALLCVAAAGLGLRDAAFSMEYRDFFGGSDPRVAEFDAMQRTYTKSDNILIVLAPASGDVFTRETLGAVAWLTERAWTLPHASRVDSITNYQNSVGGEDDLAIEDLAAHPENLDQATLDRIRDIALNDVLLVDRAVSRKGHVTGINVTFRAPGTHKEAETAEAVNGARQLTQELREKYPDIEVYLSGTLTISHAFFEVTQRDLMTLIPLMFAVLGVVLAVALRSAAGAAAAFLVVIGSTVVAVGIGTALGMRLTPPAAAATPIIMTLAIADCVHLFSTYVQRLRGGADRVQAMTESIVVNLGAVTLTTVTTAIGFATMNLADSPPFHDLGNLVVGGVLAAYVLSLTVFSSVVTLLPFKPQGDSRTLGQEWIERYAEFAIRNRRRLLAVSLGACVILASFIPRNQLNDEFLKYFDTSVQFRRDNDFITRELTGVYQLQYSIRSGARDGITSPEYLRVLDEFSQWFRAQPEVWHVESLADVLKRINRTVNADDAGHYRLPSNREEAAQFLLLFEMSLPNGLDLNDRISVDKAASRMVVGVRTIPAKEMLQLEERAAQWLQGNAPSQMRALATGPAVLFAHIGMNSIYTGLQQEIVATVLISVLLLVALRSLRIGLLSLVPNIVPAAAAFGLWGLLYGRINMALATVAGMALGIIVDDTIHWLSKYLHARRVYGATPEDAVRYAMREIGGAVVTTSVTLICGFLVLTFSPFMMNWGMGLLTSLTVFFAMLFDLMMLPGLILAVDRESTRETADLAISRT